MRHLSQAVSEGVDIIDSRDVIARIEELESERACFDPDSRITDPTEADFAKAREEWDEGEDGEELKRLRSLADDASDSPDWEHGESLISEHHFEDYARQLAEDIGALEDCDHWPATCIDWERAAEQLQQDYTSVTYGDTTYWIRS
jgi:hypothetical protein